MDSKFQIWFKELNSLTPEQNNNECQKMRLEIQTIELKLFIHYLFDQIRDLKHKVEEKDKLLRAIEIGE